MSQVKAYKKYCNFFQIGQKLFHETYKNITFVILLT